MRRMPTKPDIEWQFEGQMTIFDFIDDPQEKKYTPICGHDEFETMPELAAVSMIEDKTKLKFNYDEEFNEYIATKKGYKISIRGFDHYFKDVRDGKRFLSVDVSKKNWGASTPAESIEEAVDFIERQISKCYFSQHNCNKEELWKIADTLDDIHCQRTCCRACNTRNCGARCNGSEEPKEKRCKYFPGSTAGTCTHETSLKHIEANRLNLNITCNSECCYECQDKCRYSCYVVQNNEKSKGENVYG